MIETHAHLYFDRFDEDREAVIQRAFDAGVEKIINIGIDLETSQQCVDLAESYDPLFATAGIHPNDSSKLDDDSVRQLVELTKHPKVVAVGEIGLDFYWDKCPVDLQKEAFRRQIRIAKDAGLPIVIHNREAGNEIVELLRREGTEGLSGVFHCFSEELRVAEMVLELGFHISFTGNLTFKKSELPEVAAAVPVERLLLETDCPFLSPEPKRGRRNEPAHIAFIAQRLAEIKEIELSALITATTANAESLFELSEKASG